LRLRWWIIAAPLVLVAVIGQIDKMAISVVMSNKQFLQDMKLIGRPAVTGLLMSGFLLSYALFHFFWGYVVKRFGPRACAIAGILVWAGSLSLSGAAHFAGTMITARVILGVGEAFMYPVFNAFVANWFAVKERARAGAFWMTGITAGPAVAGALVVTVIAAGGWRMVFFALAVFSLLLPLPLLIFLMRDHPRQQKLVSSEEVKLIEEGSLEKTKEVPHLTGAERKKGYLGNYRFWLLTLAWGFSSFFVFGWTTWMPTYLQTARHFSFQSAGGLYSLSFFFALIAVWGLGYASDRIMRRASLGSAAYIVSGLAIFAGGVIIGSPYWAIVALIIAQCGQSAGYSLNHALVHSIVPEHSVGAAVGVAGGVGQGMAIIAPTLIGFLVGVSGFGAGIFFLALSGLFSGVCMGLLVREGY
jgi:ACS family glucarate transporter-like MFS transporter